MCTELLCLRCSEEKLKTLLFACHRENSLSLDGSFSPAMLEIVLMRYQVDSQDGLKYAERAVKLAPQIPFGRYMLGLLRLDTGDAVGAVPELEIAQKAFPNVANIYYSLGNAYSRVGRKAEAARARAKFVRLNTQKNAQDAQQELEAYRQRALSEAQGESSSQGR